MRIWCIGPLSLGVCTHLTDSRSVWSSVGDPIFQALRPDAWLAKNSERFGAAARPDKRVPVVAESNPGRASAFADTQSAYRIAGHATAIRQSLRLFDDGPRGPAAECSSGLPRCFPHAPPSTDAGELLSAQKVQDAVGTNAAVENDAAVIRAHNPADSSGRGGRLVSAHDLQRLVCIRFR